MSTDDLHLPSDQMDLLEDAAPWDREEEETEEQESEGGEERET